MANVKLTSPDYSLNKNQKVFRVKKVREKQRNSDVRISDLFKEDLFYASRELSEKGFKLYIYLISNQDGYVGGLSKVDVVTKTGISDSSYNRAVNELIEKGFLTYTHENVTDKDGLSCPLYDFVARPDLQSN